MDVQAGAVLMPLGMFYFTQEVVRLVCFVLCYEIIVVRQYIPSQLNTQKMSTPSDFNETWQTHTLP